MVFMAEYRVAAQDAVFERIEASDFVRFGAGVGRGNQGSNASGVGAGVHDGLSIMELKTIAIQPPQRHANAAALPVLAATPGRDALVATEMVCVIRLRR